MGFSTMLLVPLTTREYSHRANKTESPRSIFIFFSVLGLPSEESHGLEKEGKEASFSTFHSATVSFIDSSEACKPRRHVSHLPCMEGKITM